MVPLNLERNRPDMQCSVEPLNLNNYSNIRRRINGSPAEFFGTSSCVYFPLSSFCFLLRVAILRKWAFKGQHIDFSPLGTEDCSLREIYLFTWCCLHFEAIMRRLLDELGSVVPYKGAIRLKLRLKMLLVSFTYLSFIYLRYLYLTYTEYGVHYCYSVGTPSSVPMHTMVDHAKGL
jgi:hypothetical protein